MFCLLCVLLFNYLILILINYLILNFFRILLLLISDALAAADYRNRNGRSTMIINPFSRTAMDLCQNLTWMK